MTASLQVLVALAWRNHISLRLQEYCTWKVIIIAEDLGGMKQGWLQSEKRNAITSFIRSITLFKNRYTKIRDSGQISPGQRLGRYEILDQINLTGLSALYLARDPDLQRDVVLKFVLTELIDNKAWRDLLLNEGRILGNLRHPSIHSVFDTGETMDGRRYFVFEHLDGGSFSDLFQENNAQLPFNQIVDIIASIADALDYVHRRGYVHRDVKPHNILLDSAGKPRLTGFEIAIQSLNIEASSFAVGTPAYMAPEQFSSSSELLGPHTDVWGLGVTLYESLAGRQPYEADSVTEILQLIRHTDPSPPSTYNSIVPTELDEICLKCLTRDLKGRYGTAGLLASDLRAWQYGGQPRKQRRVFVSHSSNDRRFVEHEIIAHLEKSGIKTWYSTVDIQSASEWERSILSGLESCEWFLVVMSPRATTSEWVKDEIHWAIENRSNRIIPVLIEDCNVRDLHIRLARIQHVDFRNPSPEAQSRLVNLFKTDAA